MRALINAAMVEARKFERLIELEEAARRQGLTSAEVTECLARLEQVCDEAAYNCVLHTAPWENRNCGHYHWHWEILPRIVKAAGFEWGTGVHINPVSPERAAATLRAVTL